MRAHTGIWQASKFFNQATGAMQDAWRFIAARARSQSLLEMPEAAYTLRTIELVMRLATPQALWAEVFTWSGDQDTLCSKKVAQSLQAVLAVMHCRKEEQSSDHSTLRNLDCPCRPPSRVQAKTREPLAGNMSVW